MENFEFYNPTKIFFGQGGIEKLSELIKVNKVLILYGEGSIKKNGVYDQVKQSLKEKVIFEISGVKPNPSYDKGMEAVHLIRQEKIEFILAVGGGSVIDLAKFIALAVYYSNDPWEILTNRELNFTKAIPLGVVLTLPATGSEMNSYFVISKGSDKLSAGSPIVFPQFSILDPMATMSLTTRQVGNGVVDAFIHVTEQYLTYKTNAPLQERMAEAILTTLIEEGPKSYAGHDLESRANHMWCATMALNGLVGVGVPQDWATHMIGHELTALYGIDHARSLALVFPSLLWVMRKEKRDKIKQYAQRIWGLQANTDEEIKMVIIKTEMFFQSLGVPTKLKDYQIDEDVIEKVINRFQKRGVETLGECDRITLNHVKEILRGAIS
jgi:NADP-dependent alcohol dehydrogenase